MGRAPQPGVHLPQLARSWLWLNCTTWVPLPPLFAGPIVSAGADALHGVCMCLFDHIPEGSLPPFHDSVVLGTLTWEGRDCASVLCQVQVHSQNPALQRWLSRKHLSLLPGLRSFKACLPPHLLNCDCLPWTRCSLWVTWLHTHDEVWTQHIPGWFVI
jgi:hypothetical protein